MELINCSDRIEGNRDAEKCSIKYYSNKSITFLKEAFQLSLTEDGAKLILLENLLLSSELYIKYCLDLQSKD